MIQIEGAYTTSALQLEPYSVRRCLVNLFSLSYWLLPEKPHFPVITLLFLGMGSGY